MAAKKKPLGGNRQPPKAQKAVKSAQAAAEKALGNPRKTTPGGVPRGLRKMPGTKNKPSVELKIEYITDPHSSCQRLAEKYGMSIETVRAAHRRGEWAKERAEYWEQVSAEAKQAGIARMKQVAVEAADNLGRTLSRIEGLTGKLIGKLEVEADLPDDMRTMEDEVTETEDVPGDRARGATGAMEKTRGDRTITKAVKRARPEVDPRKLAVAFKTHVDLLKAALIRSDDSDSDSGTVFEIQ